MSNHEGTFESSEAYIKHKLSEVPEHANYTIHISPEIPEKKLVNATKSIAADVDPMLVCGLIDATIFGSAKEGVVFTGEEVFIKTALVPVENLKFADIESIVCEKTSEEKSNGKTKNIIELQIKKKDSEIVLSSETFGPFIPLDVIGEVIDGIINQTKEIKSTEQMIRLSDLEKDAIKLYLKIVMNYLREDDGIIDIREYTELVGLMARLNVSRELADELRDYRLSENDLDDTQMLLNDLFRYIPDGSIPTICQSLLNDLLIVRQNIIEHWDADELFLKYKNLLEVKDDQVDFFVRKLKADQEIIKARLDDDAIKKVANELMAIGTGAGVSLAALAVTGGISTGIWGGLFTLGMASTGGMLLGLAVVGGLGYGAYKGIKYFSGTSELEKSGIRISMLQEKIKQLQKSQNFLLEDINYTTSEMAKLVDNQKTFAANQKEIMKLLMVSKNLTGSSEVILLESEKNEKEALLSKLPGKLDYERFQELAGKTAYFKIFNDLILEYYKENEDSAFILDEDADIDVLEKILGVLEKIGYYDTSKSLGAHTSILTKKGIGAVKNLLNDW